VRYCGSGGSGGMSGGEVGMLYKSVIARRREMSQEKDRMYATNRKGISIANMTSQ